MDLSILIPVLAGVVFVTTLGFLVYYLTSRRASPYRNLMQQTGRSGTNTRLRAALEDDESGEALEQVSTEIKKKLAKKPVTTPEERLFRAGIFSDEQKKDFERLKILCPVVCVVLGGIGGVFLGGVEAILLFLLMGGVLGAYLPLKILSRREAIRSEEILFYLPLVIEQVSIGVSSSLDVGPCVQRIVEMADERDTHNPVTELLRYAQFYVKSGAGFEEALAEIGRLSGHHDLKHALLALSQVQKYGGEISRQLQELADAVSAQREARVEEKIKKLELAASAPVALVFFGFLVILITGFGLQIVANM